MFAVATKIAHTYRVAGWRLSKTSKPDSGTNRSLGFSTTLVEQSGISCIYYNRTKNGALPPKMLKIKKEWKTQNQSQHQTKSLRIYKTPYAMPMNCSNRTRSVPTRLSPN